MVVQLLALSPHSKKVLHAAIRCGICVCSVQVLPGSVYNISRSSEGSLEMVEKMTSNRNLVKALI